MSVALDAAFQSIVGQVTLRYTTPVTGSTALRTRMTNWNAAWPLLFDENLAAQRTVRDWFVNSKKAELSTPASIPNLNNRVVPARIIMGVLEKTIGAAVSAEVNGNITTAQANALAASFVTAW